MSLMKDKLDRAVARYEDVPILLDGEAQARRDQLERELLLAQVSLERAEKEEDKRLAHRLVPAAQDRLKKAEQAILEFEDEFRDAHLTVRVTALPNAAWRSIQLGNPKNADKKLRSTLDEQWGYDVAGCTEDYLRAHGRLIDGDELEKPSNDEWTEFLETVDWGSLARLGMAIFTVNEMSGIRAQVAARKG